MTEAVRLKRLSFRSRHRGCKESDLIFGPFADAWLARLTPAQIEAYERLLDEDDADIWDWLTEKQPLPPRVDTEIFSILKNFALEKK